MIGKLDLVKGTKMSKRFILIDYENIQPAIAACATDENTHILIFVGARQGRIKFDIVASLQKFGSRAEYIKIKDSGENALDFHIAYYIGLIAALTADTHFLIVSKDKGFDPLVAHLKEKKIDIRRIENLNNLAAARARPTRTSKIGIVIEGLEKRGASKPKTLKTLASTINAMFQNKLAANDVQNLIKALQQKKYIEIKNAKISYPDNPAR